MNSKIQRRDYPRNFNWEGRTLLYGC